MEYFAVPLRLQPSFVPILPQAEHFVAAIFQSSVVAADRVERRWWLVKSEAINPSTLTSFAPTGPDAVHCITTFGPTCFAARLIAETITFVLSFFSARGFAGRVAGVVHFVPITLFDKTC